MTNKNSKIIEQVKKELRQNIDLEYKKGLVRFDKDKEAVLKRSLGIRTPIVRQISAKYFRQIKCRDKTIILKLCKKLLGGYDEESTIAFDWDYRIKQQYTATDFVRFEKWIKQYIHGWGNCDDLCTHSLGYFLFKFPEFVPKLKIWVKSKNRWLRRAAAVGLIYPIRKKKYLKEVLEIADLLLTDKDDLVQKGYGWLLKETADNFLPAVFDFVYEHKNIMTRIALRYAIEKMPREKKLILLKKSHQTL